MLVEAYCAWSSLPVTYPCSIWLRNLMLLLWLPLNINCPSCKSFSKPTKALTGANVTTLWDRRRDRVDCMSSPIPVWRSTGWWSSVCPRNSFLEKGNDRSRLIWSWSRRSRRTASSEFRSEECACRGAWPGWRWTSSGTSVRVLRASPTASSRPREAAAAAATTGSPVCWTVDEPSRFSFGQTWLSSKINDYLFRFVLSKREKCHKEIVASLPPPNTTRNSQDGDRRYIICDIDLFIYQIDHLLKRRSVMPEVSK